MEPLKVYHVYNHANGFENLFKSDENYRFFLRRYEYFIPPVAETLAYCLMPNHIHFLIRIKSEEDIVKNLEELRKQREDDVVRNLESFKNLRGLNKDAKDLKDEEYLASTSRKFETSGKLAKVRTIEDRITKQFGSLFSSYAQAFNKMYDRRGSLFIPNYKRAEVTNSVYFTNAIRYIHANPVHHGFAPSIGDWPWSSYSDIIEEMSTIVNYEEIIQWFGSKEEFIKFHQQPVDVRTRMAMDA